MTSRRIFLAALAAIAAFPMKVFARSERSESSLVHKARLMSTRREIARQKQIILATEPVIARLENLTRHIWTAAELADYDKVTAIYRAKWTWKILFANDLTYTR